MHKVQNEIWDIVMNDLSKMHEKTGETWDKSLRGADNTSVTRIFSVTVVPRKHKKIIIYKLKTVRLVSFAGRKITGKIYLVLQYIKVRHMRQ